MAYKLPPQYLMLAAPTAADAGYPIGAIWVNQSTSPRAAYVCTDNSSGAATWERYGNIPEHTGYNDLSWELSGHDGGALSVASFTSGGTAAVVQSSDDGQFVQRVSGNLVFTNFAGTINFGPNVATGYAAVYAPTGTTVTEASSPALYPIGSL